MFYDIESNELEVARCFALIHRVTMEGKCILYNTRSVGEIFAFHPLENLLVPPRPHSPLINTDVTCHISFLLFKCFFSDDDDDELPKEKPIQMV